MIVYVFSRARGERLVREPIVVRRYWILPTHDILVEWTLCTVVVSHTESVPVIKQLTAL